MSIYFTKPLRLDRVRTYPLAERKSKVTIREFAGVPDTQTSRNWESGNRGKKKQRSEAGLATSTAASSRRSRRSFSVNRTLKRDVTVAQLIESLPRILAGNDFRAVIAALEEARRKKRPMLWGIGGHVIKVGLAPVLIDLMRRGYVSGIAMNGAALVHDFEIAMVGNTSEDVETVLGRGEFGMAHETGLYLNEAAVGAARSGIGLGEAAGKLITNARLRARHLDMSVLAAAYDAKIPVTVHLAIGTDIPHMHPAADGAALGAATHHDFRLFCALVKQTHTGGVYLNWGSAVLLPEVFLKAVSVAQNLLGKSARGGLRGITTANFDFLQHYRPMQNVVKRPTSGKGSHGYSITGHHEIMLPLLAAALRK